MLEVLRTAADEGVERVEYLGGDESYKLELSDRVEPLYQGVGMARTLQGRVASSMRLKAIDARIRLKSSDTLRRLYYRGRAPERSRDSRGAREPGNRLLGCRRCLPTLFAQWPVMQSRRRCTRTP